jgi:hypothetical protein
MEDAATESSRVLSDVDKFTSEESTTTSNSLDLPAVNHIVVTPLPESNIETTVFIHEDGTAILKNVETITGNINWESTADNRMQLAFTENPIITKEVTNMQNSEDSTGFTTESSIKTEYNLPDDALPATVIGKNNDNEVAVTENTEATFLTSSESIMNEIEDFTTSPGPKNVIEDSLSPKLNTESGELFNKTMIEENLDSVELSDNLEEVKLMESNEKSTPFEFLPTGDYSTVSVDSTEKSLHSVTKLDEADLPVIEGIASDTLSDDISVTTEFSATESLESSKGQVAPILLLNDSIITIDRTIASGNNYLSTIETISETYTDAPSEFDMSVPSKPDPTNTVQDIMILDDELEISTEQLTKEMIPSGDMSRKETSVNVVADKAGEDIVAVKEHKSAEVEKANEDTVTLSVESELHGEDSSDDNALPIGSTFSTEVLATTPPPTVELDTGMLETVTETVSVELVTKMDNRLVTHQENVQKLATTTYASIDDPDISVPQISIRTSETIQSNKIEDAFRSRNDGPEGRSIAGLPLAENKPLVEEKVPEVPAKSPDIFDLLAINPTTTNCTSGLTCDGGQMCLDRHQVCDGLPDCLDGRDEGMEICDGRAATSCRPDEFACLKGRCIPLAWKCDGRPDCSRGEDELACEAACPAGQFICHEGRCLPNSLQCDGREDCGAGEDEVG